MAKKVKNGRKAVKSDKKGKGKGDVKSSKKPRSSTGKKRTLKSKSASMKKVAGKGKGKGKGTRPGNQDVGVKRKLGDDKETETTQTDESGKKQRPMSEKKRRRKEMTSLYSELINPTRERKTEEIVGEILALLTQRTAPLSEYCSKEIGSRVLQACLKWGSQAQRRKVLSLLRRDIVELSMDRYGHVLILKLLKYVSLTSAGRQPTPEEKKQKSTNLKEFLEPFQGKTVITVFFHRFGCRVINGMFFSEAVPAMQKRLLFSEVVVPKSVALLRPELPGKRPLRELLTASDYTDEQRRQTMDNLREIAEKTVDKELLAHDIVHLVFQAFCENASESQLKDLADKCMDGAPYLLSSKPGSEALIQLLGVATAKQKKTLMRDLKGKFAALAMNSVDYLAVMRLCSTVDDTVLLGKTMLSEWTPEIRDMCFDKYGHRVLVWLFCPGVNHFFSPYEQKQMSLPSPSSVKAPEKRRDEVVRVVRPHVRKVLLSEPLAAASDLSAKNLLVAYLSSDWDSELVESLLQACASAAEEGRFDDLDNGTLTTALLTIFKIDKPEVEREFAVPFWERVLRPHVQSIMSTRMSFVALALLKLGSETKKTVLKGVRSHLAALGTVVKTAEAAGTCSKGLAQFLTVVKEVKSK